MWTDETDVSRLLTLTETITYIAQSACIVLVNDAGFYMLSFMIGSNRFCLIQDMN